MKNLVYFLMAVVLIAGVDSAFAATNDETKYQGDKLSFPVNVHGKYKDNNNEICIPAKTPLRGLSDLTKDDGLTVRLDKVYGSYKDCNDDKTEIKNIPIQLTEEVVTKNGPNRYGITYGGLVVPFKYHPSGSKEFKGGSTVAPYLGYRFDRNDWGLGLKLVGFLGGSIVSIEQDVNGETKTQNLAGFSYGVGIIGTIKGEFQMGVVFGVDQVSESANYKDNGKVWIAVGIGFSFSE